MREDISRLYRMSNCRSTCSPGRKAVSQAPQRRWATLSDKTGRIVPNPSSAVAIPPTFTLPQSIPLTPTMDSYDENEFQPPSTPLEPPVVHSDTVYQSGNPSQYLNLAEKFSDSDEYDDPSFMPSDEEGKEFVDEFPSQLAEALLPLEAEQNQQKKPKKKREREEKSEDEDEDEEEDDGLFRDEFPKDLPAHPANFLWPDALPKEKEKRDRPYPDTDIYPPQRSNPYVGILPTGFKDKKKKRKYSKGFRTPIPKEPKKKKKKKKQKKQKEDWEGDNSDDESVDEEQKVADETWLNYNADEIELVDSLDRKEAQDLGAQLVNFAGLKRSRWDYEKIMKGKVKDWHNKRRWQRDVPDSEEARQAFERDDTWCAWPLEPWKVPREGEKDAVDEFRWREKSLVHALDIGGDHYKPSREMEEVLTAEGVKLAKERFEGRKWKVRDEITSDMEREEVEEFRENAVEMGLDPDEELERVKNEYYDEPETEEAGRTRFRWLRDRKEPAVDADDDRNKARMRVPVRHALSRLDDLLLALRKNRTAGDELLAGMNGTKSQDASRSTSIASAYAADTTDGNSQDVIDRMSRESKPKRKVGKPKKIHLRDVPEYKQEYITEKVKGKRGRPKKVPIPQEGETQEEAIIRMHRKMKKKVPVFQSNSKSEQKIKDEPNEDIMMAEYSDVEDANAAQGGNISPELIGYLEEQTMLEEAATSQTRTGGNLSPELIGTLEEQTMLEEAAAAQASQDFPGLDQDDIKHSDSDCPVREGYIASQYNNWPYPKEMWKDRMARRKAKKGGEEAEHREWMTRYANRDWSDVLGMAAIIGFPPKVIQKTAQRLTVLLGEGIDLRVFQRLPDRETTTLVTYRPEKIPSDDGLFGSSEESSEDEEENEDEGEKEDEIEDSLNSATSPKRSMSSVPDINMREANQDSNNTLSSSSNSTWFSDSESEGHTRPIEESGRQMPGREMSTQKASISRLRRRHDWSEYDIEEFDEETSDKDEMLGGVLRDGFLKKIKSDDAYDRRRKRKKEKASEEETKKKKQDVKFKSRISPEL